MTAVVTSPRILTEWRTLEFTLALVSPVTLVVFLTVLYLELTHRTGPGPRQTWALAAASGMAVRVGLVARHLHESAVALRSLPPPLRAQLPASTLDVSAQ